jgi:hypothetical protein
MAVQDVVKRYPHGAPSLKIPFIVTMVDANNQLRTLPFPPQEGLMVPPEDSILGVELMVNPMTMSTNLAKLITRSQSMTSFVEDHWGEELDTLTFQGFTAAFVTGASDIRSLTNGPGSVPQQFLKTQSQNTQAVNGAGMGVHDNEPGLTVSERRKSMSYHQFRRVIDLFRVNGCFFDSFGRVSKRYFVMISFGLSAFKGFFESIDTTEEGHQPFRFQYTVTFKSEETVYKYGVPKLK